MDKKIIATVREDKAKQRRVNIPKKNKTLKNGDLVEIKKVEIK